MTLKQTLHAGCLILLWILWEGIIKSWLRTSEMFNTAGWVNKSQMYNRWKEEDTIARNKREFKIECIEKGWKV